MALRNKIDTEQAAERLADWLASKMVGARHFRVTDVHVPGAAGLSNETVLFHATWHEGDAERSQGMVARVQPDGLGVLADYDLHKEATVMSALAGRTSVCVPQVLFYEDDPTIFGSPFLVMERVDGRVPSDDPPFTASGWVLDLSPEQRRQMWDNGIDVMAQIHGVDRRDTDLGLLDPPGDSTALDAQLTHWRTFYATATEGQSNPTIEAALAWLDEHRPTQDEDEVLNWGDARVGNIIFADDLRVAAVLDWEMVVVASREYDLGWWLFMMRHHTEGIGLPLPDGIPDRAQTIARYEQITGHRLPNIEYYEIFAATRMAIIMVRAANMLITAGMLPPDSPMALSSPASQILAKMLDLPVPTGDTSKFLGAR